MLTPRVSVFMASYNGERFVEASIRSILGQTLDDLELVIVDDASEAATVDILRRIAATDSRIRLVEASHEGQIGTLNHALSLCRAPYIARIDHDDLALPNRLEIQLDYLQAHPDVVAVGGEMEFVDERNLPIPQKRADPLKRLRYSPTAFPPKQVFLSGSTLMARKSALDATAGFRSEFTAAEDRDICWQLSRLGRVVRLADVIVRYRVHQTNMSLVARRMQLFSQFLSNLSAIAVAVGCDDAAVRAKIVPGGDYVAAIEAYRELLGPRYPVETYRLFFLARMRMWRMAEFPDGAALLTAIKSHYAQQPLSLIRLRTLWTALRYSRRAPAL